MSKRPGDPGYAAGWCIHYRYNRETKPEADTCEAGVQYSIFKGVKFGQRPCFLHKETGESSPDAWPCAQLRRPTPEEIALHRTWLDERMNLQATVMQGIRPWRDAHQGQSAAEIVECPGCKGKLHLSISSYNGHVHGHCETQDCVSWME